MFAIKVFAKKVYYKKIYIYGQNLQQYRCEIYKLWIQKTGLNLFQSEPTIEVQLTQKEQILNLRERFDKFACSDSEGDE